MKPNYSKQFLADLRIEEVTNGFILYVGQGIHNGDPAQRYVFPTVNQLNDFICAYVEDHV